MSESERTFDRETLLDLTVNVIPLGIILFFVVVFLLIRPWEWNPFVTAISMGLLVVPFVALALLTYLSGRAISEAEKSETSAAALDESFDEPSPVESGETEASADTSEGVIDDEAAAMDDGSDTGEDADADENADDADTTETTDTDATEDDSDSDDAAESGDGDAEDGDN